MAGAPKPWLATLALALACAGVDPYGSAMTRGELALGRGEAEDAADAYEQALDLRPRDTEALHGLARAHMAHGDGEAALRAFARLEAADPGYFARHARAEYRYALYQAARENLARGDSGLALSRMRRLTRLAPSDKSVRRLLVQALLAEGGRLTAMGRGAEGERMFREATGAAPPGEDPVAAFAAQLIDEGRIDTAISALSNALLERPDDAELRRLMDRALRIRYPHPLAQDGGAARAAPREESEDRGPER